MSSFVTVRAETSESTTEEIRTTFTQQRDFTSGGIKGSRKLSADATGDGNIDIFYALAAYMYLRGKIPLANGAITAADATGDNKTNIADIAAILNSF